MSINIDFTGVDSGGFETLEAGEYDAVISEFKTGTSQAGKPKIDVVFTITSIEGNRKAFRSYSLQPNAIWALKQFMEALNMEVEEGPMQIDPSDFIGLEVVVTLSVDPHWKNPNETQNNVAAVRAA